MDIDKFIAEHVTGREVSLFQKDIADHEQELSSAIGGRNVMVIGGAGSIGSQFIKELLRFKPAALTVVDINENALAELTRTLRSDPALQLPEEFLTYPVSYADPLFERIFAEKPYHIVANFSAHKHVRSEKDRFSVQALMENNVLHAQRLMELLRQRPPERYFCVSTDKAANPVNIMGASKRLMEELVTHYAQYFPATSARFANVAFSNGSLPRSWLKRQAQRQPLVAPNDVRRYFVSPRESGQICLLACMLGRPGEIFFPCLGQEKMLKFSDICSALLRSQGLQPLVCRSEEEARKMGAEIAEGSALYPVYYFKSDTSGEKEFEEFWVEGEKVDMERFQSLGVIVKSLSLEKDQLYSLLHQLETLLARQSFTKQDVVDILHGYFPSFHHLETGRNLDQKM